MEIKKTRLIIHFCYFTIQTLTTVALLATDRANNALEVAAIIILSLVYLYIENKLGLSVSNYIRVMVSLTLIAHTLLGKLLNYYHNIPVFDNVLHIFGSYSLALFTYSILEQLLKIKFTKTLNKFIFVMLIGGSLGAGYEIFEFILDIGLKPTIPNQAGLRDTNLDMISDFIGSFIAAYQTCYIKNPITIK
ncbi:hypothetical protein JCM14036_32450 [Desulfotomaculum defluvii]